MTPETDLIREPSTSEPWSAEDRRALALRLAVQLHERGTGARLGPALLAAGRFEDFLKNGGTP